MTIRESKREIQNGSEKPVEDVMVGPWERDKTVRC